MRRRFLAGTALVLLAGLGYGVFGLSQPVLSNARATGAPQADAAALEAVVRHLASEFGARSFDNAPALDGAAAYIERRWTAQGHRVERQAYTVDGRVFSNLIVRLGPDTPDVLVVGAHYDVAGAQPGADDNASGVAGLIELTRLLQSRTLRQRVELVAYSTEEPPYFRTANMGSAVHARSLVAAGKRVPLMLSLECIGYFSDAAGSQDYPIGALRLLYPSAGNFIGIVGAWKDGGTARAVKRAMAAASPLPVHSISAPGFVVGVDFSDHLSYANEGFPAMMVTDTAFYRNKAYHTPDDTPERLDYRRMAQVVDGVQAAVLAVAAD